MKKVIAFVLAVVMAVSMVGCGGSGNSGATVEGTMEELVTKVMEKQPAEFMGGLMPVDLTDTSEDGLYWISYFTGLENADMISDVAAYEPMMSSIAFSLVMVRANDGVDAKELAEEMKANIDPRKWMCVEADDLQIAGYGDVVMLIMVSSDSGLTSQSYVDAFADICGAKPDFTI